MHGEWKTRSVCNNHELRTFAPFGFSHFCAPFFSITNVPSMKHSERLMAPRSSRSRASASSFFQNMPALTPLLNRRYQVDEEGNLSGKSTQEAPIRNTHKMPFNTQWSSWMGGRLRADKGSLEKRGARTTPCSSVNRWYLLMNVAT